MIYLPKSRGITVHLYIFLSWDGYKAIGYRRSWWWSRIMFHYQVISLSTSLDDTVVTILSILHTDIMLLVRFITPLHQSQARVRFSPYQVSIHSPGS
jgi:hypothetical protein